MTSNIFSNYYNFASIFWKIQSRFKILEFGFKTHTSAIYRGKHAIMLFNSKNIAKIDAPDIQTCQLCTGKPTFLNGLEFIKHQSSLHMGEDEKFILERLDELRKAKKNLSNKFNVIKNEIKLMRKNKVDDANIIGLLQQELRSLKVKIEEKNQDLKLFNDYQNKFSSSEFAHGKIFFFSRDM